MSIFSRAKTYEIDTASELAPGLVDFLYVSGGRLVSAFTGNEIQPTATPTFGSDTFGEYVIGGRYHVLLPDINNTLLSFSARRNTASITQYTFNKTDGSSNCFGSYILAGQFASKLETNNLWIYSGILPTSAELHRQVFGLTSGWSNYGVVTDSQSSLNGLARIKAGMTTIAIAHTDIKLYSAAIYNSQIALSSNLSKNNLQPLALLKPRRKFYVLSAAVGGATVINGNITKTKIANSGLIYTGSTSTVIAGDVTKTKTSNSTLEYIANTSIIGDVAKTKTSNATLEYTANTDITGAVTKTKTANSAMSYAAANSTVITGSILKTKTSASTFSYAAITTLNGSVIKTKVSASAIAYSAETIITGSITKTKTSNAVFDYASSTDIIGSVTKTKTSNSAFEYASLTGTVINGDVTKTKTSNSVFDYFANADIVGSITKTKTANSIPDYTAIGGFIQTKQIDLLIARSKQIDLLVAQTKQITLRV